MKRKILTGITTLFLFSSIGVVYSYADSFEKEKSYQQDEISSQKNDNLPKAIANMQANVPQDLGEEKVSNNALSKENIVGTWKLVDFYTVDANEKVSYPFGENPTGYLVYTENGYMSVSIMTTERPLLGLSVEEMQDLKNVRFGLELISNLGKYLKASLRYFSAGRNYLSYSGTYKIQGNAVVHNLEVSLVPDWIGLDFVRNVEFSEDQIILTNMVRDTSYNLTWKLVP